MKGCFCKLTPEDLCFSKPVQLPIKFSHSDLPAGMNESELHICRAN